MHNVGLLNFIAFSIGCNEYGVNKAVIYILTNTTELGNIISIQIHIQLSPKKIGLYALVSSRITRVEKKSTRTLQIKKIRPHVGNNTPEKRLVISKASDRWFRWQSARQRESAVFNSPLFRYSADVPPTRHCAVRRLLASRHRRVWAPQCITCRIICHNNYKTVLPLGEIIHSRIIHP